MSTPADPRYPIGRHAPPPEISERDRRGWIEDLRAAPALLRSAVAGLTAAQLDTPYREGGWTVRQVAHHVPDSHVNAYVRFKLALTEETPTIKPYDEDRWARLADAREPLELSLQLLELVHAKLLLVLAAVEGAQWQRTFVHPDKPGLQTVEKLLCLYAWHGKHHTAHVTALRARMGW